MTNSIPAVYRPNNIYRLTDRQRVWLRGIHSYNAATKGRPLLLHVPRERRRMVEVMEREGLIRVKSRGDEQYAVKITGAGIGALERLDAPVRPGTDTVPTRVSELVKEVV